MERWDSTIIYAVYVLTEDGKTLISEHFQSTEDIPNEVLLGGLFTALQSMAKDMAKQDTEMKSVEIEGLSYHIRSFGLIRIVLVTNVPKTPEDIIQTLGLRFINEYGDILTQAEFNSSVFSPFKDTIQDIMKQLVGYDESKSIKPSKRLNTGEIFSLPHHLQATALALVTLEEGTVSDIALESGEETEIIEKNLATLKEKGFIGTKMRKKKTVYFCTI
ncbi:MAG: hypothetical protein JSW11_04480 [Candidatus Heimdallarchaeota archaeon]|nr:MAG: hypothetical protein JSW11_04480 [Candidatus Heimdallarchaeota archaeon]